MLKNRDTASNPYRVPPQPTPMWIKISIFMLFVMNISLIGVVSFLAMTRSDCDVTCAPTIEADTKVMEVPRKLKKQQQQQQQEMTQEYQLTQAADSEAIPEKQIWQRINGLDDTVNNLRTSIDDLRKEVDIYASDDREAEMDVTRKVAEMEEEELLTTKQINMLNVIPNIQSELKILEGKLEESMNPDRASRICGDKSLAYYRYGSYCYAVTEGAIPYKKAQVFCKNVYGEQATLAIITDQLQFDFIVRKIIPKSSIYQSHWIGVKYSNETFTQEQPHLVYQNGNQVPLDSWRKWSREESNGLPAASDCIAVFKDPTGFYWNKANCNTKMNYICQYPIFPKNKN